MKIGYRQRHKPTPRSVSMGVKIYTIIAGCLLTSMASIPSHIPGEEWINWFLGITVTIGNALEPFIGMEISRKTIPTKNVSVADDSVENKTE